MLARERPTYGKTYSFFVGLFVVLTAEWVGVTAASYQGCSLLPLRFSTPLRLPPRPTLCRRSTPTKSGKRLTLRVKGVRIVALLAPTCRGCQSGHATIAKVLRKFSSLKLRAILVWEPMIEGDGAEAASQQAATFQDTRIVQEWNENRNLGKLFGKTLDLHAVARDVYLVYKPGIRWEGEQPPQPTFWMHQLNGADPKLLLCADPTRLSAEVGKLLEQAH